MNVPHRQYGCYLPHSEVKIKVTGKKTADARVVAVCVFMPKYVGQ